VAGIVQRFGGAITVRTGESIPENPGGAPGTVFEILLPRVEMAGEDARAVRAVVEAAQTQPVANNRGAMETILVVDDRKDVRALVVERLRDFGYTLLEAGSGAEAIRVAAAHPGAIDLLLTDMLMANMSGRELAAQLGPARPDMKVLYMSGIVPAGVNLESTPNFIMKPFSDVDLLAKVREMLGGDSRTVAAFGAAD
jgi:CheY-like chemotaxis protein